MQNVFQNRKRKEFKMQTVQQANWYHRGDGDQRASVLIEKSHSLFVCHRVNGHKATVKSSKWWSSTEASFTRAKFHSICCQCRLHVIWARIFFFFQPGVNVNGEVRFAVFLFYQSSCGIRSVVSLQLLFFLSLWVCACQAYDRTVYSVSLIKKLIILVSTHTHMCRRTHKPNLIKGLQTNHLAQCASLPMSLYLQEGINVPRKRPTNISTSLFLCLAFWLGKKKNPHPFYLSSLNILSILLAYFQPALLKCCCIQLACASLHALVDSQQFCVIAAIFSIGFA